MRFAPAFASIVLLACARTSSTDPSIHRDDAGSETTYAKPEAPAPAPSPTVPIEQGYCDTAADCAWGPSCPPAACVDRGSLKTDGPPCDMPVPGRCVCVDHKCTARIASAAKQGPCKVDGDCTFDAPTGRCAPGRGSLPITEEGGFCLCDAGACKAEWADRVPCTKTTDCSWLDDPRRPAPASKVPRPHPPVKPCKTGEWDSVCQSGVCRIVVWGC